MQTLDAAEVERRLDFPSLIDRLRDMFRTGCELPTRHHHPIEVNDLALSAAMLRISSELLPKFGGTAIKTSGLIGIYVFDECGPAASFAQEFRRVFAEQGVTMKAGIDVGEVLVFDLGRGRRDIAGTPVNVASKLAQDLGQFGHIYLSDNATQKARLERRSQSVRFEIAGTEMTARQL